MFRASVRQDLLLKLRNVLDLSCYVIGKAISLRAQTHQKSAQANFLNVKAVWLIIMIPKRSEFFNKDLKSIPCVIIVGYQRLKRPHIPCLICFSGSYSEIILQAKHSRKRRHAVIQIGKRAVGIGECLQFRGDLHILLPYTGANILIKNTQEGIIIKQILVSSRERAIHLAHIYGEIQRHHIVIALARDLCKFLLDLLHILNTVINTADRIQRR